jgi:hypothetical protein
MTTLSDARMPSLKDKIEAQEAESKKVVEEKVVSKNKKKK